MVAARRSNLSPCSSLVYNGWDGPSLRDFHKVYFVCDRERKFLRQMDIPVSRTKILNCLVVFQVDKMTFSLLR